MDLTLFSPEDNQNEARKDLTWILEALTQRDQAYLKDHPETPLLYKSGVVYERPAQFGGECEEVAVLRQALGSKARDANVSRVLDLVQDVLGGERFRDIGRILEKGSVDCDNVACYRAAELRQAGIKASPYITWRRRLDGGYTYHVLVRWPDGTSEDPSLLLGMGGSARKAERDEEIRKNAERIEMAKAAARRGKSNDEVVGSTHYRGGYKLSPDPLDEIDLKSLLGFSVTVTPGVYDLVPGVYEDVVGQGNPGLGNWPHGNVILPGDPQHGTVFDPNIHDPSLATDFVDFERSFDESFDEAMLRRTGNIRGGR